MMMPKFKVKRPRNRGSTKFRPKGTFTQVNTPLIFQQIPVIEPNDNDSRNKQKIGKTEISWIGKGIGYKSTDGDKT